MYQRDGAALLFTVYQLASGKRHATVPLTRGVEPDLPWVWRNRASDAGAPRARAEERELAAAISYALRCHEEQFSIGLGFDPEGCRRVRAAS